MLSPPSSWKPMSILVSLYFFSFRRPYSKHALFSDWLVFPSNTRLRFLHTGWWIIYHFLLSTESSCPLFQCSPLICPFTYGKTSCLLPVLEIMKRLLQLSTRRQTNSKALLVTPHGGGCQIVLLSGWTTVCSTNTTSNERELILLHILLALGGTHVLTVVWSIGWVVVAS